MTLANATANSINSVFAQLGIDVGPENFDDMAHKLGITSHLQTATTPRRSAVPSTCCTVLEMSNAYATLANGGVHHDPTAIRKVVFPNGDVDEPAESRGHARDQRRRRLHRREGHGGDARLRHRRRLRPARAAPPPARPERPRSSRTPGSSATRRTFRRPSGPATPTPARRCPATAQPSRRPSGRATWRSPRRRTAATTPSRRIPANLSSYSSSTAASSSDSSTSDSTPTTPDTGATTTAPPAGDRRQRRRLPRRPVRAGHPGQRQRRQVAARGRVSSRPGARPP